MAFLGSMSASGRTPGAATWFAIWEIRSSAGRVRTSASWQANLFLCSVSTKASGTKASDTKVSDTNRFGPLCYAFGPAASGRLQTRSARRDGALHHMSAALNMTRYPRTDTAMVPPVREGGMRIAHASIAMPATNMTAATIRCHLLDVAHPR